MVCFTVLYFPVFLVTNSQKVSQSQHCNIAISHKYYFKLLKSGQNIRSLDLLGQKFYFGKKCLMKYHEV